MTTPQDAGTGSTTAVRWFRVIALAEALSWVGLLAGMYFKYLGEPRTEIGVRIFGSVHGGVFIAFVVASLLVGIAHRWGVKTWTAALLGSIVPLGSVVFVLWADRTGRMRPVDSASESAAGSAATGPPVADGS